LFLGESVLINMRRQIARRDIILLMIKETEHLIAAITADELTEAEWTSFHIASWIMIISFLNPAVTTSFFGRLIPDGFFLARVY